MDLCSALCCCLTGDRNSDSSDPILDAQARQRAADAAQRRQQQFESSAHGKAAKKQHERIERERRAGPGNMGDGLASRWD